MAKKRKHKYFSEPPVIGRPGTGEPAVLGSKTTSIGRKRSKARKMPGWA